MSSRAARSFDEKLRREKDESPCRRMVARPARQLVALWLLVQQSAGFATIGLRPACACASRAGTPSAISIPAKVLAAGSALAFWRRRSSIAKDKSERFANMEWADAPDSLDVDGCEILGVEGDQGCAPRLVSTGCVSFSLPAPPSRGRKTWYACTEPAEGLDCEQNVSVDADGFICKESAPKSSSS